jgi:hypothetical protein
MIPFVDRDLEQMVMQLLEVLARDRLRHRSLELGRGEVERYAESSDRISFAYLRSKLVGLGHE